MKEYSLIQQPIIIPRLGLSELIYQSIPESVFSGKEKDGLPFDISVSKLDIPMVSAENQTVSINLPLKVEVSKKIGFISAKAEGEIVLELTSELNIDSSWKIASTTQLQHHYWSKKPQLKVLGMNIPVTKLTDNLIDDNKVEILEQIDSVIHTQKFIKNALDTFISHLENPIVMDSSKGLFLKIDPISIGLMPFSNDIDAIYTGFVFEGLFNLSGYNEKQLMADTIKFAWLNKKFEKQSISVSLDIDHGQIQNIADQYLENGSSMDKMFEIRNKKTEIVGIKILMLDDRIGARVTLQGGYKGTVDYMARPHWSSRKKKIILCDASLKTKLKGVSSKMVLFLFKKSIKNRLTKELENYLEELVAEQLKGTNEFLNELHISKNTSSQSEIIGLDIQPIVIEDEVLKFDVLLQLEGSLNHREFQLLLPKSL